MTTAPGAKISKEISLPAKKFGILLKIIIGIFPMRLAALALAMALIAAPGLASAQSVLERVLGQIDGASNLAQINGTYANIAESVGALQTGTPGSSQEILSTNVPDDTKIARVVWRSQADEFKIFRITADMIGTTTSVRALNGSADITINANAEITDLVITDDSGTPIDPQPSVTVQDSFTTDDLKVYDGTVFPLIREGTFFAETGGFWYTSSSLATGFRTPASEALFLDLVTTTTADTVIPGLSTIIDGSITNIVTGVTSATQEAVAGAATATEFVLPTFDFGDVATTALGAVNTGEITLGVNSAVDEAATSTTRAISAAMTQIGGSAGTGALVLNVASNASAVQGSIDNTLTAVNGSISNLSTTALGAVNTGTIISGVNAAVQGIVGMSGQTSSGL